MMLAIMSWTAIAMLSVSYWFQIYKTHKHKEVRDISLAYHILLAIGFGILIWTAHSEGSTIFFVKQVATFIPVCVIIAQILFHKRDKWHDDKDDICNNCGKELEPQWIYCPYCSYFRKKEE